MFYKIQLIFFSFTFLFKISYAQSLLNKELNVDLKSIKIGNQIWNNKNLSVTKFRNGDLIAHAKNSDEWERFGDQKIPAWCNYNYDAKNDTVYGKFYNWYAVNDSRGLPPEGWEVAEDSDWQELMDFLRSSGLYSPISLRDASWSFQGNPSPDSFGFGLLPCGYVTSKGKFTSEKIKSYHWTSTPQLEKSSSETQLINGAVKNILYENAFYRYQDGFQKTSSRGAFSPKNGCSIRCVRKDK